MIRFFEEGGTADILIIDHRMPGLRSGIDAAIYIKNNFENISQKQQE